MNTFLKIPNQGDGMQVSHKSFGMVLAGCPAPAWPAATAAGRIVLNWEKPACDNGL
jgi:hypothetical protein